jgi:uncharacterized membrane protein
VPDRPRRTRALSAAAGAIALVSAVGLVLLRPSGEPRAPIAALSSFEGVYAATTIERAEGTCQGVEETRCVDASFRLEEGPDTGRVIRLDLPADQARTDPVQVGAGVLLAHQPDVEGSEYIYLEPDRRTPLWLLTVLFAAAVVVLGRGWGARSLIGLAATLLVLFLFVLPAILDGRDPLAVSLVGAIVIAFASLYLSHGFDDQTTVALLGTLGGLCCATVLAVAFMELANITGVASEEALFLSALGTTIDLRGVILGGMMIGALGAIDDMTVTQAAAIWELNEADPAMPADRLLRAGMRVGRRHVASTVNTLVLAYAGASMPLLILFVLAEQPITIVASGELVATEIVRTLAGSLGLVASVPITTWLATRTVAPERGRHVRVRALEADPVAEMGSGPEEHPIPEHRFTILRLRRSS